MPDLKFTDAELKEKKDEFSDGPAISEMSKYPHGLSLHLEERELKMIPGIASKKAGDEFVVEARVRVTKRVVVDSDDSDTFDKDRMELQVQELYISGEQDAKTMQQEFDKLTR